MIELRWVKRSELAPEYGEGIAVEVRVLQWRTQNTGDYAMWSPWSNWKDVPVVEQED